MGKKIYTATFDYACMNDNHQSVSGHGSAKSHSPLRALQRAKNIALQKFSESEKKFHIRDPEGLNSMVTVLYDGYVSSCNGRNGVYDGYSKTIDWK